MSGVKKPNMGKLAGVAREQFLEQVHTDEEFIRDFNLVNDYSEREKDNPLMADRLNEINIAVRDKWHLTDEEYLWLSYNLLPPNKSAAFGFKPFTHEPIIELLANSTLAEVTAAYHEFDKVRRTWGIKPIKKKAVLNPTISYSVFKGLQKGKNFKQIFAELTDKNSPIYNEQIARIFDTPEELRVHYNQNKP